MDNLTNGKVLLLLSGGIDSLSVLHWFKQQNIDVEGLFVDYGQPSAMKEEISVMKIKKKYKIKLYKVKAELPKMKFVNEIIGRNNFLISLALLLIGKQRFNVISLGIHSGTGYIDCSEEFFETEQLVCDMLSNYKVRLNLPFLRMNKVDIIHYAIENNIDLSISYSCELGLNQPCTRCHSCKTLKKIYGFSKSPKRL